MDWSRRREREIACVVPRPGCSPKGFHPGGMGQFKGIVRDNAIRGREFTELYDVQHLRTTRLDPIGPILARTRLRVAQRLDRRSGPRPRGQGAPARGG